MGDQSFTILVLMSVLVTALVSPLLTTVVKPVRRLVSYKRRTIRWSNPESELRILACVHFPRDVPSLISLVDIAHPTKRSPISVSALHLIELAGRASAFLLINASTHHHNSRLQAQSEHIAHAFESYEQHAGGVSVHNLIAVSPYATMHEDAVGVAEDRHVALVLLPFHMHRSVDGGMEVSHPAIRGFNKNVMSSAPSTVGILVDRGLGGRRGLSGYRIAVLFFGGHDDREALALAGRMVGHPAIELTVIRFIEKSPTAAAAMTEEETRENRADEECIREFLARVVDGEAEYEERALGNAEDVMASIREAEGEVELFVVGKGQGAVGSQLTAGMTEWSEFSELGPIGDLLASTDSTTVASVLVVQAARAGDGVLLMSPERREEAVRVYLGDGDYLQKVERR